MTHEQMKQAETVPQEESVEALEPLNGHFTCTYYKGITQKMENIHGYEVVPTDKGWNWVLETEEGGSVFFTQTAGQFCYVEHVEEE